MIDIRVNGIPSGQGNLRVNPSGFAYHTDKRLKPWRDSIISAVLEAWGGAAPWAGSVGVTATFVFPYRKIDLRKDGSVKESAPKYKTSAPDLDHLERALGDSLKQAGALIDDALIVHWDCVKVYGQQPGLEMTIRRI